MVIGKVKNKKIGWHGEKKSRSIQKTSSKEAISRQGSQKKKAIHKKKPGACHTRHITPWAS